MDFFFPNEDSDPKRLLIEKRQGVSFTGSGALRVQLFLFNGCGFFLSVCAHTRADSHARPMAFHGDGRQHLMSVFIFHLV